MKTVPSRNAALQDTNIWIFKSLFVIKSDTEHKLYVHTLRTVFLQLHSRTHRSLPAVTQAAH
jgi:hypothetical protein